MSGELKTVAELLLSLLPGESIEFGLDDKARLKVSVRVQACGQDLSISHILGSSSCYLFPDDAMSFVIGSCLSEIRDELLKRVENCCEKVMAQNECS